MPQIHPDHLAAGRLLFHVDGPEAGKIGDNEYWFGRHGLDENGQPLNRAAPVAELDPDKDLDAQGKGNNREHAPFSHNIGS